jgi:suppressor for copper-sensitivity B
MNQLRFAAAMFVLTLPAPNDVFASPDDDRPVTLSATTVVDAAVVPGAEVTINIVADITDVPDAKGKHWHIYPPAAQHRGVEIPTSISVTSATVGVESAGVAWPPIQIIRNAFGELQPVYEGRAEFTLLAKIAADAQPGEHQLDIEFSYQTCASLCLPPTTETLSVGIVVESAATPEASGASIQDVTSQTEGPMSATLTSSATSLSPSGTFSLQLEVNVDPMPDEAGKNWHFYPRKEDHKGVEVPSSIDVTAPPGFEVGAITWPPPGLVFNAEGMPQPAYDGDTTFLIPITVLETATPGNHTIEVALSYQVCASQCLFPTTLSLQKTVTVDGDIAAASKPRQADPEMAAKDATSLSTDATVEPAEEPAVDGESMPGDQPEPTDFQTSVFGANFGFSANSVFAVPMLMLFAFVGGFLLNLTPCVLPIIPIKIMGLTQSAAGDPHRAKVLGVAMGIGILAFWLAIGAAISFVSGFDSISSLFQRPIFGISVGLFIAFMGIGMLVDMSIQLPQAVHRINPKHDTLHGAFLFGVMTAVLSTPCTAPFMGSAAAWATKADNSALVIGVFAAIAVGMGWPYVLLSWYPKLVSKVPRSGPASVLVKQVMGLLMLAVAAFFGGTGVLGLVKEYPHLGQVLHWWVATALVAAMCIWLTLQTFRITTSTVKRIGYSLLSLGLFAGMAIWSNGETADAWEATELHNMEDTAMRAYVAQLELAVSNGDASQALHLRPPPWRRYDPESLAKVKAEGLVTIVHFTADW